MFDEKYMEIHNKPLDTPEDIAMFLASLNYCTGTHCHECATRMYGNSCVSAARRIGVTTESRDKIGRATLVKLLVGIDLSEIKVSSLEAQEEVYKRLFVDKKPQAQEEQKEEPSTVRACSGCAHSQNQCPGILFCDSFHNFVYEDDWCSRFEPANM